jgi:cell division protein FtsB
MTIPVISRLITHIRTEWNPIQWIMMLLFVAFCWFAVFGNQGLYTYYSLSNTHKKLISEEKDMQVRLEELRREEKLLHDPRYLETIIRQELGYIRPGEIIYQLEK